MNLQKTVLAKIYSNRTRALEDAAYLQVCHTWPPETANERVAMYCARARQNLRLAIKANGCAGQAFLRVAKANALKALEKRHSSQ